MCARNYIDNALFAKIIMNILYDHQIYNGQKIGGISRYFTELYRHLNQIDGCTARLAVKFSDNEYLTAADNVLAKKPYVNQKIYSLLNRLNTLRLVAQKKHDVLHCTNYRVSYLSKTNAPLVVTVYDLIHEKYPEQFRDANVIRENLKNVCSRADKIVAISLNTKKDLVAHMSVPASKIEVIYLDGGFVGHSLKPVRGLPQRYVLFVGARNGYKNFDKFIKGMAPLLRADRKLKVLCTGYPFTSEEMALFLKLGVKEGVVHKYVQDDEFYTIYTKALLFVFPSMYEGFGIPVLEAMDCACPVALSDTPVFREVGANAAVYFDPCSEDSIRERVASVIENEKAVSRLRELGKTRKADFCWRDTAMQSLATYQSLVA